MSAIYNGLMRIAEAIGEDIYRFAKCNPLEPPRGGAVEVAIGVLGGGAILFQPRAMAEADIAIVNGQRTIAIRRGIPASRMNFLVGQQLARTWLTGEHWYMAMGAEGRAEITTAVAAWLVAPSPAFSARAKYMDGDIARLAGSFGITETCAAMRWPESGGPDAAVITASSIYRRGRLFSGFGDKEIRTIAAMRSPRSVRRVPLLDEPGRVALFSLAAAA